MAKVEYLTVNILLAFLAAGMAYVIWYLYDHFFEKPRSVLKKLKAQGIPGYDFRPFVGQLPELIKIRKQRLKDPKFAAATHATHFWFEGTEKFGPMWFFSLGNLPRLVITDPALVRQAYVNLNAVFQKNVVMRNLTLLVDGLLTANGNKWTMQRRLINPAFNHREIKRIFPTMVQCTQDALSRLEVIVKANPGKPILANSAYSVLTLDIICRSAFGANMGFGTQDESLGQLVSSFSEYLEGTSSVIQVTGIFPAFKYLPTTSNRKLWKVENIIRRAMKHIIGARLAKHKAQEESNKEKPGSDVVAEAFETDLLELMMNATEGMAEDGSDTDGALPLDEGVTSGAKLTGPSSEKPHPLTADLLFANCVTFLLAGHETTADLLTWTSMLLSQHQVWQEKAREEVNCLFAASGGNPPSFEQLSELKIVGWVINEALRLYPPASVIGRTCTVATRLSDTVVVPRGCDIFIPIAVIHRDKSLWGEDADEFRPDRFANGISKAAKHPNAFMPFSVGPRTCIGQNFALAEAKVILAMLLNKFSWTLSRGYIHHPELSLTVRAKRGMPLIFTPLS